jgi:hypothetical protein
MLEGRKDAYRNRRQEERNDHGKDIRWKERLEERIEGRMKDRRTRQCNVRGKGL